MLEDSEIDAALIEYELRTGGVEFFSHRVDNEPAFIGALMSFEPDVILSDYRLPDFDGAIALELAGKLAPEVPVIFVSGTIGEELAVELLKMGAVDYVLKDRRSRLVAAIWRALREIEERGVRRLAEEQVRKLSRAVDQSPVSIIITDLSGFIEYVNPKFEEVTGYSALEVLGRRPTIFEIESIGEAEYARLWEALEAGLEWRGEFCDKKKNGELFWEFATISPIRDARGEPTHYLATKEDITEKKKLEAQFLRAQRMETLGALAGGIAHDLNNILTPIVMCAPMLRDALHGAREQRMIATIEASAQRGADIVKQILTFSRGVQGKRAALNLSSVIEEMVKMAKETFPKDIRIETVLGAHLPTVIADATQLHQVLLNLCVNARDAMPHGGTLKITATGSAVLDGKFRTEARHGDYVLLEVSDTGTGIAADILDKIFEPFFTTKTGGANAGTDGIGTEGSGSGATEKSQQAPATSGGTGLGLSTTAAIIRSHDGFISVSSTVNSGSCFKIYLPAAPAVGSPAAPAAALTARYGRGELVLVIDDDVSIQTMARTVIELHGYRTITASNSGDGLALYKSHRTEIVAVLTDVSASFPDGLKLVRGLLAQDESLKIVVFTDHADAAPLPDFDFGKISATLPKPYTADALLKTLASVLALPSRPPSGLPTRV
ncbi:MAG: hybrid sensor histidine kinase/response regulator [Chthoniobacteraceae bacterium]|nr:hybrid sensor histidine kinase/response regulator [Chthoniobacteraceae bacterium]